MTLRFALAEQITRTRNSSITSGPSPSRNLDFPVSFSAVTFCRRSLMPEIVYETVAKSLMPPSLQANVVEEHNGRLYPLTHAAIA